MGKRNRDSRSRPFGFKLMKNFKFKHSNNSRGIAILTVMVSLALMMALVSDLSTKEITRYKLALNDRDALRAEALAQSGANFSQLILLVQEPLQGYLTNFAKMGMQLPAYTVWELMPIDSDLLKGITDGSFMPDFGIGDQQKDKPVAEKNEAIETKAKVALSGPYEAPQGGYGGFEGRFSSEIEDEEKKISLRRWSKIDFPKRKIVADQIYRILAKPENTVLFDGSTGDNKNINASQLVGYIYDYLSEDEQAVDVTAPAKEWGRNTSGPKRAQYIDTPDILPKRASPDSLAELRLVPGMTDAIYQVLSKYLTIHGESDKINILSASDEMLASVFYLCSKNRDTGPLQRPGFAEELVTDWNRKKNEGKLEISTEGVLAHLEENRVEVDKEECKSSVGTESKTFTVKSTATVGNVSKTILMRLRSSGGITTIYQYQYL